MNWMDKLERKWGRHAVANLSRYFVLAQVIGYVVQLTAPGLMSTSRICSLGEFLYLRTDFGQKGVELLVRNAFDVRAGIRLTEVFR